VRIEVHVARRLLGRALAEVDERLASVGEADQHVAAAAEVAGEGMRGGHREPDGNRGVHGVAAGLEDGHADVGGLRFHGDDHPVPRADRLMDGAGRDGENNQHERKKSVKYSLCHLRLRLRA
jgi:hypothetical protein